MLDWITEFNKHVSGGPNLLVLDNFSVHCTNETNSALAGSSTTVELLPPNFTSKLQPLDVGVNKPFKDRLKKIYMEEAAKIPGNQTFSITRQMIAGWIAEAWSGITTETILNTIRKIGFLEE